MTLTNVFLCYNALCTILLQNYQVSIVDISFPPNFLYISKKIPVMSQLILQ